MHWVRSLPVRYSAIISRMKNRSRNRVSRQTNWIAIKSPQTEWRTDWQRFAVDELLSIIWNHTRNSINDIIRDISMNIRAIYNCDAMMSMIAFQVFDANWISGYCRIFLFSQIFIVSIYCQYPVQLLFYILR